MATKIAPKIDFHPIGTADDESNVCDVDLIPSKNDFVISMNNAKKNDHFVLAVEIYFP